MKMVVRVSSHLTAGNKDVLCICKHCEVGQPLAMGYVRYRQMGTGIELVDLMGALVGVIHARDEAWLMPRLRRGEFWLAKFRSRCGLTGLFTLDPPTVLVWRDPDAEKAVQLAAAPPATARRPTPALV